MRRRLPWRGVFVAVGILWGSAAVAGPPYVSDDPEPTDLGHWEIYNFVEGVGTPGDVAGDAGFDLNYGAAKDVQVTLTLPALFDSHTETGPGAIELAVKYKFLHQSPGSLTPDVAVFPRLFFPTVASQFGPSHLKLFLPVWAEKDWGKWSLFGGGGYDINPGPGNRNFWLSGVALTREVSSRLQLGAEVYHQGPQSRDAVAFTGVNAGAIYKLSNHWSLLASGGPGVQNPRREGEYDFYFALEANY